MRRHVRTACKIAPNQAHAPPVSESGGDTQRPGDLEVAPQHTQTATGLSGSPAPTTAAKTQQATESAALRAAVEALTRRFETYAALTRCIAARGKTGPDPAHTTNNITIDARTVINVFGREALERVTTDHIRGFLDEALLLSPSIADAAQSAVMKTAMLVYSNPDHPENLTCYLPNKKTDDAMVRSETGWEVQPAALVLSPMAQKSIDMLFKKQPYQARDENTLRAYGQVLKTISSNEHLYSVELRPVLVRNKALLERIGALAA